MQNPPDVPVFNQTVWEIVQQVPRGQVTTFGQIASIIPAPAGVDTLLYERFGAQWVGKAMNAVSFKDEATVPWWRVINSKGGISLPPDTRAHTLQRERLAQENVVFDGKDRVDFNRFGWDGPPEEWLKTRHLRTPKPLRTKPDTPPQQMSLF